MALCKSLARCLVIKGGKPVRIIDNLIANAAVASETGIVIWPGFAQEVEMSRNVISGYTKYGIALLQNPCFAGQLSTFDGKISGSDNLLAFNQQGNLCPADYPWPQGFVKP